MNYLYRLFHGLIYPGILGAAIIWLVQYALSTSPSLWIFIFGAWFIVYHASLFMRLQNTDETMYNPGGAITDLGEAASVIIGYHGLGLVVSDGLEGQPYSYHLIYTASLMVPVIGTVTNAIVRKVMFRLLAIPAALFSLLGLLSACMDWTYILSIPIHDALLFLLWMVLVAYLYCIFRGDDVSCWLCKGGR